VLRISERIAVPESEIRWSAVHAQGPGGQNVNKVATAVHLRFDIRASSLPERYKERLLALQDRRLTKDGTIVVKAQGQRTLEQNREQALRRLAELIRAAGRTRKARKPTRPTRGSQQRRLERKKRHGRRKALRGKVPLP
jgi:ribosome-associated protein